MVYLCSLPLVVVCQVSQATVALVTETIGRSAPTVKPLFHAELVQRRTAKCVFNVHQEFGPKRQSNRNDRSQ